MWAFFSLAEVVGIMLAEADIKQLISQGVLHRWNCPGAAHPPAIYRRRSLAAARAAQSLSAPGPAGGSTIDSRLSGTRLLCPPVTGLCLCVTLSSLRRDNTFPPASQRTHSVMDRDCQEAFNRRLPVCRHESSGSVMSPPLDLS